MRLETCKEGMNKLDENHQGSSTADEFEFLDHIDFLAGIDQKDEYDWINHIDFLADIDGIGENSIYSNIDFLANIDLADTDQKQVKRESNKRTIEQGKPKSNRRNRYQMKKIAIISVAAVAVLLVVRFVYPNAMPEKEYSVMAKDETKHLTPEEQFDKQLGYVTKVPSTLQPTQTPTVTTKPNQLEKVEVVTKPEIVKPTKQPTKQPIESPVENPLMNPKEEKQEPDNILLHKPSNKGELKETLFIGDSRTEGLKLSTGLKEPVFYCSKGLTVKTVFEQQVVRKKEKKKKQTVIEALDDCTYKKVYIMFGVNELGWAYEQSFKQQYKKLITVVKEKQPQAEIYIQSILPVNEEQVYKPDIYNNKRINNYNKLLREVATETECNYLDVASAVKTKDGILPKTASSDGIHLNKEYCLKWIQFLKEHS